MSKVVNNEIQANSLADNKTQAKAEVGDVWNYEGIKRVVLAEGIKTCDFFGDVEAIQCLSDTGVIHWYNAKLFVKQAEYIGKSKVKIEDLFKTENK